MTGPGSIRLILKREATITLIESFLSFCNLWFLLEWSIFATTAKMHLHGMSFMTTLSGHVSYRCLR